MSDPLRPPKGSLRAGYELRDINVPLVVAAAVFLVGFAAVLHLLLWEVALQVVPEQQVEGTSPPVQMPREPPVKERIGAVTGPRLEVLRPLRAEPPSYRSSQPLPQDGSWQQRPEDLRAERQPALNGYSWIEPGKVARIPIKVAKEALVEIENAKSTGQKRKGGKK